MMVSEERGEAENKRLCSINSKIKLQNGGAPGPTKSAGTHGPCRVASQRGCGLQRFGYLWTPRDRRDCCKPGFVMSWVERPPRTTSILLITGRHVVQSHASFIWPLIGLRMLQAAMKKERARSHRNQWKWNQAAGGRTQPVGH